MDSYGQVDQQQRVLQSVQKTRKRIAVISLSSILLVCVVVAAVLGTVHKNNNNNNNNNNDNNEPTQQPLSTSVKAVCDVTLYKDLCYSSMGPILANSTNIKPKDILKLSIQLALNEVDKVISTHLATLNSTFFVGADNMTIAALENCRDLLDMAMDQLNTSLSGKNTFDDFKTWLSSAITMHDTCIDGFENSTVTTKDGVLIKDTLFSFLNNSTQTSSNSLAIINWLSKFASSFQLRRRLMSSDDMPEWLSSKDRKLLQAPEDLRTKADAVVAKDGSGKYKTITAALKAVPDKSDKRFIIYVKKGVYLENVRVEKTKWNVLIIGDGMDATVVSASLNVVDGTPTFSSATFAALGKGFIARDIGFKNTAGAIKHQAVALMSTSDMSVFYHCRFDAFQDTLYTHSQRQFYRECNVHGTVDFIFGNAAVIFQNCNILPKKPMQGQQNTITAQGKVDPNQNTGSVFQNCSVTAGGDLTNVFTYLGRPWKIYSTTIFMQSYLGSLIHPLGWLPWVGTSAPDTIFYSEYQNVGPGSSTKNRVKWKGLRTIPSVKEASKWTVTPFLQGDSWISSAGVTFKSGL